MLALRGAIRSTPKGEKTLTLEVLETEVLSSDGGNTSTQSVAATKTKRCWEMELLSSDDGNALIQSVAVAGSTWNKAEEEAELSKISKT